MKAHKPFPAGRGQEIEFSHWMPEGGRQRKYFLCSCKCLGLFIFLIYVVWWGVNMDDILKSQINQHFSSGMPAYREVEPTEASSFFFFSLSSLACPLHRPRTLCPFSLESVRVPQPTHRAMILSADEHWASVYMGRHPTRQPVSASLSVKGWSVQKN